MSDYFDRVEAQIVRNVEAGLPRPSHRPNVSAYLAVAAAAAVVIVVAGAILLARGSSPITPPAASHPVTVTFKATAIESNARVGDLDPVVAILRDRLGSVFPGARVSRAGNEIVVTAPNANADTRAGVIAVVTTRAQLDFYDWEANVITPNGKTVASQLQTQDPTAIAISQGADTGAPGQPGAGSMNLYDAVTLASRQPPAAGRTNSRITPQYWMFGAPGSAACGTAARARRTALPTGEHCLLAGPDDSREALLSGLPAGVRASNGQILVVPRGTVVLQAIPASFSNPPSLDDPSGRFFVLKDNVALYGSDITNPKAGSDPNAHVPMVSFGFTNRGKNEFQTVTANIARRGEEVSSPGQTLNQHFAVALDNRLITVPFIGFKQYPNGINGDKGADIGGSFSAGYARDLATILRYGPLPVALTETG